MEGWTPNDNFSPEEAAAADEIFRRAGQEMEMGEEVEKIESAFMGWLDGQTEGIKSRLERFGVSLEESLELIRQIRSSLTEEVRSLSVRLAELRSKLDVVLPSLKKDDRVGAAFSWLETADPLEIIKIIQRKLTSQISEQERFALQIIDMAENGGKNGSCVTLLGTLKEINILLLNDLDFSGHKRTLDHEISHYALGRKFPEADDFLSQARANPDDKGLTLFANFLLATDESFGHITERQTPDFQSYAGKISPKLFESVYSYLEKKAGNLSEEERDKFFIAFYGRVLSVWRNGMNSEEFLDLLSKKILINNHNGKI